MAAGERGVAAVLEERSERRPALLELCGGDGALRCEVELLLRAEAGRRSLTMAESELDIARKRPDSARQRLTTLRATLARAGKKLAELECVKALHRLDHS
jgi:hypothetical protein